MLDDNKSLLLTIIQILSFEQNNDLIIFGLLSLLSIIKNNKSLSIFLVDEGDILIPLKRLFRLNFKSLNIFLYDVELIKNLCFSFQNLEPINNELSENLLNILFIFKKTTINNKIINIFLRLMECFILLRENRDFKNKLVEDVNFNKIINLYIVINDVILKERILQLLINLIIQDESLKSKFEENIFKTFIKDFIIHSENKKYKIIERLLHIFLLLKNNKKLSVLLKKQEIINILNNLEYLNNDNILNKVFSLLTFIESK